MAKQEELQSRFKEVVLRVSDPKMMVGKVLAGPIYREWTEDFVDESTGEVVPVHRKELVIKKGVVLDDNDVATIMFHQQAGDVADVLVSNQKRTGDTESTYEKAYTVDVSDSRSNHVLYIPAAYNPCMAYLIAADYAENTMTGFCNIGTIKPVGFNEIKFEKERDDNEVVVYFQVTILISEDGLDDKPTKVQYITIAKDTNEATAIVEAFREKIKEKTRVKTTEKIIKVEPSRVTESVPVSLCQEYIAHYDDVNAWAK